MRKHLFTAFTIAALALPSVASAQMYGYGRQTPMYPSDPRFSIGAVQQRGYALSMRARQMDLATDCTDYGYGDCRERMVRSGAAYGPGWAITGPNNGGYYGGQMGYGGQPTYGYGGGYYGRPVQSGWGYRPAGYGGGYGYGGGWNQPNGYIIQRRVVNYGYGYANQGGYYNAGYGYGGGYHEDPYAALGRAVANILRMQNGRW